MPSASPSIPEFMREGSSVADFNTPSRTIVGALEERSTEAVMSLYGHLPGAKISDRHRNRRAGQICRQHLACVEGGLHQRNRRRGQHVRYRQRRGDAHFRRGQPAQHFQGLYAARLCLWRLMLAEGSAGARLFGSDPRSVAPGHQPHPRQQPDADRPRARLDSDALQEARCLSRDQLQARNGRRPRKPVRGSRGGPERQGASGADLRPQRQPRLSVRGEQGLFDARAAPHCGAARAGDQRCHRLGRYHRGDVTRPRLQRRPLPSWATTKSCWILRSFTGLMRGPPPTRGRTSSRHSRWKPSLPA